MMKYLLALFALNSAANTVSSVYLSDSNLSSDLKEEIIHAVKSKFPCLNPYSLKEQSTIVVQDRIDQGIIDLYFTTTFKAQVTYDYHPRTISIVVESVRWDGSNPSVDWTDITSITSENFNSCD